MAQQGQGDILAQADGYVEPAGADFSYKTWRNYPVSDETMDEKSKKGADTEAISSPVVTITSETSATSADNFQFVGRVEDTYAQMQSLTYELTGGNTDSGLITSGNFLRRVSPPFGGSWRLPVSPLAVGQTGLFIRGTNVRGRKGPWTFGTITRTPTAAPHTGPYFDEFDDNTLAPWWTVLVGVRPTPGGGTPCTDAGIVFETAAPVGYVQLQQIASINSCSAIYQNFDGNFDAYVKLSVGVGPGHGGGTEGAYGVFEMTSLIDPLWCIAIWYTWSQGDGKFELYNWTRTAANLVSSTYFGGDYASGDIWLRLRFRAGDAQPLLYSSVTDGAVWDDRRGAASKNDLSIVDFSQMRLGLYGVNADSLNTAAIIYHFLRDGSGI